MNKVPNILFIISLIIFLIALIVMIPIIKDTKQEKILEEELSLIAEMSFMEDSINTSIKTKNEYAKIEKTIKEYVKEYQKSFIVVFRILENNEITKCLSVENLKGEVNYDLARKNVIQKVKELNTSLDNMIRLSKEESLKEAILDKNLDKKYVEYYEKVMIEGLFKNSFKKITDVVLSTKEKAKDVDTKVIAVLDFLEKNKSEWKIKDEAIVFNNQKSVDEYNDLISKITK